MGIPAHIATKRARHIFAQILIASAALVSLTVCLQLHFNIGTASLLYVVVVVLLARVGDFVSSIVASVVAALCLAYLAPPSHSFRVDDPFDLVAVAAFLTTALVIASLVFKLRRMAEEALTSVDRRLIDAEERERDRIARKLHDDIGQRIAFVKVKFEQLSARVSNPSVEVLITTDELLKEMDELCADIQTLAHSSNVRKLEYLGLVKTVRSFCKEFGHEQKVEINFRSHDVPNILPRDVSLSLFRVLQEALHNAVKHSGTRQFEVELFETSEAIHLIVHDSGRGFSPNAAMRGAGLGLISMQERIKLVKGELLISTQLNRGTTIHATVPLSSIGSSARTAA